MWVNKYIGQKWTQEHDCSYWFRRIQKEEFGREIPVIYNQPNSSCGFLRNAMKLVKNKQDYKLGWKETEKPIDGDAALLAMRTVPHHIGIVCYINNILHILHATEELGVVISSRLNLKLNNWRIAEFLTYEN